MRRTKIVCTLGPSTEAGGVLEELVRAGMDVARFNLSHGGGPGLPGRIGAVRRVEEATGATVGVLLDTRGPEIRCGGIAGGGAELPEGRPFTLTTRPVPGDGAAVSVDYDGFPSLVSPGDTVVAGDGDVAFEVVGVEGPDVLCRVSRGGLLTGRRKLNVSGARLPLPPLTPEDEDDLRAGLDAGVEFVAASFVRSAGDVLAVRELVEAARSSAQVIAKLETRSAVESIDEILRACDGVMIARGDLGVEYPPEEVPLIQKAVIERANRLGKPVITATQMLESMVEHMRPTRAEASDVANAILDGSDAVMLSEETAVGRYPAEAVRIMARIAERTEEELRFDELLDRSARTPFRSVTDAISYATCSAAEHLGASAILTATHSGHTARMVSRYRPRAPVVALTPDPGVARRLKLTWGAVPVVVPPRASTDETMDGAVRCALEAGLIDDGDLVVITAGVPSGIPGTTNILKVQTVGDILVRGVGIGGKGATGRACVARDLPGARERLRPGDILVTVATDRDYVPLLKEAAGLVAEEGGLTSHAAIAGMNLGIPVVVGAEGATGVLRDGGTITIDAARGLVYRGEARVL